MNLLKQLFTTATTCLVLTAPTHAFEVISAEDVNTGGLGTRASLSLSQNAEAEFLSKLTADVGTENFESYGWATSTDLTLTFPGAGTATLGGNGQIYSTEHLDGVTDLSTINSELSHGRYAASGVNYWHTSATVGGSSTFTIDLESDIAAFGFYAYDLGDFGGELQINLYKDGVLVGTIDNSTGSLYSTTTSGGYTGSAVYIGIVGELQSDGTYETFDKVEFEVVNTDGVAEDFFAFDDMTIGTIQQLAVYYAD